MPEPFLARARRLSALVLAVAVLGAMAVAFQVSFAAIIYQGDLAQFVDRGIALTLMGAAAMAVVGALTLGYRGTCCQPQDAPAIVISLAAASIAAGMADPASEQSFATVAALVAVTAAASGLAAWLLGRLRLGFVARFIPFPVLGGFLAATGYLLVMGALGISIGTPVKVWNLGVLLDPGNVVRWLPWAALAAAGHPPDAARRQPVRAAHRDARRRRRLLPGDRRPRHRPRRSQGAAACSSARSAPAASCRRSPAGGRSTSTGWRSRRRRRAS